MDNHQFNTLLGKIDAQTEKLTAFREDFVEFKTNVATRVGTIEEQSRNDRFWSRLQTVAILPVVTVLHIIAKKLGV